MPVPECVTVVTRTQRRRALSRSGRRMSRRAGIAVAMLVALAAAAPVAHADSREASLFEAPRELMSDDAALRAKTLDEIQGFGVSWVRVVLYWRNVAPNPTDWRVPAGDLSDPGRYDWARYDRAINEI